MYNLEEQEQKEKIEKLKHIILLWKKLKVEDIVFEYNCGGDSMNDTTTNINLPEESIKVFINERREIERYFEDEIYNKVEFYEASDGHYQGEFGNVLIELVEEKNGTAYFTFTKESSSEWSETYSGNMPLELTKEEYNLLNKNVESLADDGDFYEMQRATMNITYKGDVFFNKEEMVIFESFKRKLADAVHNFNDYEVEENDYIEGSEYGMYSISVADDMTTDGNTHKLVVEVSRNYNVVKEDDESKVYHSEEVNLN